MKKNQNLISIPSPWFRLKIFRATAEIITRLFTEFVSMQPFHSVPTSANEEFFSYITAYCAIKVPYDIREKYHLLQPLYLSYVHGEWWTQFSSKNGKFSTKFYKNRKNRKYEFYCLGFSLILFWTKLSKYRSNIEEIVKTIVIL